jgi:hypothetical protein
MTMVKLPNLENEEVHRIVEALDHYCAHLRAAQREDGRYAELTEMLRRRTLRNQSLGQASSPRTGITA